MIVVGDGSYIPTYIHNLSVEIGDVQVALACEKVPVETKRLTYIPLVSRIHRAEVLTMKAMKVQVPNTRARKLYKSQAKETSALPVKRVAARRGEKARSVVDDTFAALAIRKHAKIALLIDQTKYGD